MLEILRNKIATKENIEKAKEYLDVNTYLEGESAKIVRRRGEMQVHRKRIRKEKLSKRFRAVYIGPKKDFFEFE